MRNEAAANCGRGLVVAGSGRPLSAMLTGTSDELDCPDGMPHRVTPPFPVTGEKRRPGRCNRAADVAWPEILIGATLGGKDHGAAPGPELANILEARPREERQKLLARRPDGGLRPTGERKECMPAGGGHPTQLGDERDHVLQDDEVEVVVRKRERRTVTDLEAHPTGELLRQERFRLADHLRSEIDADHLGVPKTSRGHAGSLSGPGAEVEDAPGSRWQLVETTLERKEAFGSQPGVPRRSKAVELAANGAAEEPPERRPCHDGPRGETGEPPAGGFETAPHAGVRRSSSPTWTENMCAALPWLIARAVLAYASW